MEPRRSKRVKVSSEGGALGALSRQLPVVFESEVLRHLDCKDLVSLSRVNKECRRAVSNAWKLARADHYDSAASDVESKLESVDPATVHPLFAGFALCAVTRFRAVAEEARAEVADD